MIARMLVGAALAALPIAVARAQDDCFPATDSHEARTLAILSVPLAFSDGGGTLDDGRWSAGIEVASLPDVPADLATPTTCRPGKGPENTNPIAGMARLRLGLTAAGWHLSIGWIPPVSLQHVRANLVAFGVARTFDVGGGWRLAPRLHALVGALHAPVTCSDEAIADPTSECFGGTRSDDRWRPGIAGAELVASRPRGRVVPYAGVGYSLLRPRFRVSFTNALGETDRRRVTVDLERVALFAGLSYRAGPWLVTTEGYGTLSDRLAGRLVVRHGW